MVVSRERTNMDEAFVRKILANYRVHDPERVALDVGSHWGEYWELMTKYYPVHAFEPFPPNFNNLCKRIYSGGETFEHPVHLVSKAVTDVDGSAPLFVCGDTMGSMDVGALNYAGRTRANSVIVPTVKIDTYVEEVGCGVGLIKVDVEGGELEVFRGAEATLARDRPDLIVETHLSVDIDALTDLLTKHGYDFLDEHGERVTRMSKDVHYFCTFAGAAG